MNQNSSLSNILRRLELPCAFATNKAVLECIDDSVLRELTSEYIYFEEKVPENKADLQILMSTLGAILSFPSNYQYFSRNESSVYFALEPRKSVAMHVDSIILRVILSEKESEILPYEEIATQHFTAAPGMIHLPYRCSARAFSRIYMAEYFGFRYRHSALLASKAAGFKGVESSPMPHSALLSKQNFYSRYKEKFVTPREGQVMLVDKPFYLHVKMKNKLSFYVKIQASEEFLVADMDRMQMIDFFFQTHRSSRFIPKPINALTLGLGTPAPEFKICQSGYSTDLRLKQAHLLPESFHFMFTFSETPMYDRILALNLPVFRKPKLNGHGMQDYMLVNQESVDDLTYTHPAATVRVLKCRQMEVLRKSIHGDASDKKDIATIYFIYNDTNPSNYTALSRALVDWTVQVNETQQYYMSTDRLLSSSLYEPMDCFEWLRGLVEQHLTLSNPSDRPLDPSQSYRPPAQTTTINDNITLVRSGRRIAIPQFRYYAKRFMPHIPFKNTLHVVSRESYYEWMRRAHSHLGGKISALNLHLPKYHEASVGVQAMGELIPEKVVRDCHFVPREALILIVTKHSEARVILGPVYQVVDRVLMSRDLIFQEMSKST